MSLDAVLEEIRIAFPPGGRVSATKLAEPVGFDYTTPSFLKGSGRVLSAREKRAYGCIEVGYTAPERRKMGCVEEIEEYIPTSGEHKGKVRTRKVFTGRTENGEIDPRCKMTKRFTGNRCTGDTLLTDDGRPVCTGDAFKDPRCSRSTGSPCSNPRFENPKKSGLCPIQSVWVDGRFGLRLCGKQNKGGQVYAVSSPAEAMQFATKACAHWAKKNSWRGFKPGKGVEKLGLGGKRTKRKTRKRKRKRKR